jgi:hypothetical protein
MTDRLSGTNVGAEQRARLLEKVPKNIGDWHGDDRPIDPNVRKTAGAIGAVSRTYRNARTGEMVDLWLVVGHARDISFHTPNVCYPSAGFNARTLENGTYLMQYANGTESAPFLTNVFQKDDEKGQALIRVFWSWYNPDNQKNDGKVIWEAPGNARWYFGNSRGLYKIYFTSVMRDPKETADQSSCIRFARDFLPEVNSALKEVSLDSPGSEAKTAAADNKVTDKPSANSASSSTNSTSENAPKDAAALPTKTGAEGVPASVEGGAKTGGADDPLFAKPSATKSESK